MIRTIKTFLSTTHGKHLAVIFVCALMCRLLLFFMMVADVDTEIINNASPDVTAYVESADAIASELDFSTDPVYIFGPGYPSFLALMKILFGTCSHLIVLVQILLSCVGSVLLAKLAFKLTGDLRISFIAGMLNALSVTSISLANTLLSETVFFVLVLAGFLWFIKGLERDRVCYSLLAGLCLAVAALTRSMGQLLFVILILMSILLYPVPGMRWTRLLIRRLKHLLPAIIIMVAIMGSWVIRTSHVYGVSLLSGAAPEAVAKIGLLARSDLENVEFWDLVAEVRAEVKAAELENGKGELVWIKYADETWELARDHPFTIAKVYLRKVVGSVNTDWPLIYYGDLTGWMDLAAQVNSTLRGMGLNIRASVLAIIGLVMLFRRKRYSIVIVLVGLYAYFALAAGFSVGQGMRYFYPGQIAWTIMAAFPLLWLFDWVKRLIHRHRDFRLDATDGSL
ncbi:MAG: glycosyltransferase family 39 protein [Candidatus Zixiibacteriota bacterium]|nr:MAG: glycosyltransferase family 39 protein [candidate division Zixibacteria bacterium]